FVMAAGYLALLLLRGGDTMNLVAYLISAAGSYVAAANGLKWLTRLERARAREERLAPNRPPRKAPSGVFARKVDKLFEHYFAKYAPEGKAWGAWVTETAGIRRHLRDEIVDAYRGTGVTAEQIAWLIRHRVSQAVK